MAKAGGSDADRNVRGGITATVGTAKDPRWEVIAMGGLAAAAASPILEPASGAVACLDSLSLEYQVLAPPSLQSHSLQVLKSGCGDRFFSCYVMAAYRPAVRVDLIAHLHPGSQLLNAVSDGTSDLTDRRSVPNLLKTVPSSSSGVPPVAYQMLGKVPKGG